MELKEAVAAAKSAGYKFATYTRERAGSIYEGVLMAKDPAKFLNHGKDGAILTYSFSEAEYDEDFEEEVDPLTDAEVLDFFEGHEVELAKCIEEVLQNGDTEGIRI